MKEVEDYRLQRRGVSWDELKYEYGQLSLTTSLVHSIMSDRWGSMVCIIVLRCSVLKQKTF